MRIRGVVFALTCLLSIAADSVASPITISTVRKSTLAAATNTWLQYVTQQISDAGIVAPIGSEARHRKFDGLLMRADETLFDGFTMHGHSGVINVSLNAPDAPGNERHFTFLLLPQPTPGYDGSLDGAELVGVRSKGAGGKSKKVGQGDDRCNGDCPTPVPEPASAMLLVIGVGVTGIATRWRRKH